MQVWANETETENSRKTGSMPEGDDGVKNGEAAGKPIFIGAWEEFIYTKVL
jgi:hypothetical protein